jgi:hypothetical protein
MDKLQNNEKKMKAWNGSNLIFKNLPFLGFLALLGVLYIANSHHAEKNLREIQVLKKELNEAKYMYRKIKHETIHNSTQSELKKKVEPLDLKVSKGQPNKIIADNS